MTNKDLISQYVDTGLSLPKYQVMKLSNQDKRTYIRKRWIAYEHDNYRYTLEDYEFELLSPEIMAKYAFKLLEFRREIITKKEFNLLPQDAKVEYVLKIIDKKMYEYITPKLLQILPTDKRIEYALINLGGLGDSIFQLLSPEGKAKYALISAKKGGEISDDKFKSLTPKAQIRWALKMSENKLDFSNSKFLLLPKDIQDKIIANDK